MKFIKNSHNSQERYLLVSFICAVIGIIFVFFSYPSFESLKFSKIVLLRIYLWVGLVLCFYSLYIFLSKFKTHHVKEGESFASLIEKNKELCDNIINAVSSILIVIDKNLNVKNVNLAYFKIFPRLKEEIVGKKICNVIDCHLYNHETDSSKNSCSSCLLLEFINKAFEKDETFYGCSYEYSSEYYGKKYFRYSLKPFNLNNDNHEPHLLITFTDISSQIRHETQVEHLKKIIMAISQINQTIIREKNKTVLLSKICASLIEVKGYKYIWVGLNDEKDRILRPAAQAGFSNEDAQLFKNFLNEYSERKNPYTVCIQTREPFIIHNIIENEFEELKQVAVKHGFNSCISVPLIYKDHIYGNINFHSENINHFDKEEIKLLQEVANDIAFALNTVEIGEQKSRIEDSLEESKHRYKMLFENADDIIFLKDREGRYISFNPTAETILGIDPSEWIGKTDFDFLPKDIAEKERYDDAKVIATGEPITVVNKTIVNNVTKYLETKKQPIKNRRGEIIGIMGIARDITERRNLEDQLRHAQKMEVIGQLAGGVAHDFNNLLQAIIGYNSMMLNRLNKEDVLYQFATEISKAGNTAAQLTNQLLVFSRRKKMSPEILNVNKTIVDMSKMLGRIISEVIKLNIQVTDDVWKINADKTQFQQVLMNLCVNARDAMLEGGTLTITTQHQSIGNEFCETHPWANPGNFVMISVTDTGSGIHPENMGRIFEPFFTTKEVGKGTGLGLSLVYGIIKQHGGMIHTYSELGQGTEFKIYIPIAETGEETAPAPLKADVVGGNETILFAEDDDIVRNLARKILEGRGYKVILASNGKDAVKLYEENSDKISVLLFDVIMPEMTGFEAYKKIAEKSPKIRPIFMSGYSDKALNINFIEDVPYEILSKPFQPDDLLRKLRKLIDTVPDAEKVSS